MPPRFRVDMNDTEDPVSPDTSLRVLRLSSLRRLSRSPRALCGGSCPFTFAEVADAEGDTSLWRMAAKFSPSTIRSRFICLSLLDFLLAVDETTALVAPGVNQMLTLPQTQGLGRNPDRSGGRGTLPPA